MVLAIKKNYSINLHRLVKNYIIIYRFGLVDIGLQHVT